MMGLENNITNYVLGTWAFGDAFWGESQHNDIIKTIAAAIRLGIRHFDTASSYGNGLAEQIIGQQLRKDRENFIISTKLITSSPEKLLKQLDISRKRLFSEYIDIFYIHWPSSKIDSRPMFEKLLELKEKGIIKAIGLSNFSIEEIKQLNKIGKIDIIQDCYNLLWRKAEEGIIPFCQENNIKFAAYSPLAQGILSGAFPTQIEKHRANTVFYQAEIKLLIQEALQQFNTLAKSINVPAVALALKWLETREIKPLIIFGARTRRQLEESLSLMNIKLEAEVVAQIGRIFATSAKAMPENVSNIFNHKP